MEEITENFLEDFGWIYTSVHTFAKDMDHVHHLFEIAIQLSGKSIHHLNGEEVPLSAGQVIVSKPGDLHRVKYEGKASHRDIYLTERDMKRVLSAFKGNLYEEIVNSPKPISFSLGQNTTVEIEENIALLLLNANRPDELHDALRDSVVAYIVGYYVRNKIASAQYVPQWIKDLILKMSDENNFQYKVEDFIKETNYSYGHAAREFKKATKTSLKEFILKQKLKTAVRKLLETEKSASEIAYDLYFFSPSAFTNTFKKAYGLSPNQFRKKYFEKRN